jgi:hypothetical protein
VGERKLMNHFVIQIVVQLTSRAMFHLTLGSAAVKSFSYRWFPLAPTGRLLDGKLMRG